MAEHDYFAVAPSDPDYQKALEMVGKALGPEEARRIEQLLAGGDLSKPIAWFFAKSWGALYDREEKLGNRERVMLLIGTDLALGRADPLRDHVRAALHFGFTPEDIVEAMFHAAFYVGVPALAMAMRATGQLLTEAQDKRKA